MINNSGKIFISYARADDEPFVKQLYQDLTERGFDIWWDRKAMDSRGLTFLQEIRDAIEGSDRLIAVIGPYAVKSEYVKVEWEHGLLFAKGILPILRMGDFDQIPQELSKFHCPDFRKERPYKDALDELVRILSEPVPPLGAFNTSVPSLPPHFQSRRDEITHIGEAVLADIQRPTAVTSAKQTTAIVGMGGSGKSVLAAAFARATETRRAFTNGIFWLQIGQNPAILSNMRSIGLGLKDDPGNYVDIERAKASLPKVLGDKVCLIVLDDIWNVNHVAPFKDTLGPRCRLLITTRDGGLATALDAQQHLLGMLTDEGAVRLLADWCGKEVSSLQPEAAAVAKECGYLPFALALCGAMARDGVTWYDMMEALNEADLAFIEKEFPNYPYKNVLKSLKISIDALAGEDPDAVKHYQELVVFHDHRSIPEAAIMTLWMHTDGLKERNARKLLVTLNSKALLRLEGEATNRSVTLHDLQHDYLRATAGDLKNLNEKLLAAYQKKSNEGWAGGPNDGYFFENLGYHLVDAGRKDELRRLLFDFGWMQAKLEATDVNSLIKDYDYLSDDRTLGLVQGAIQLSAHVLANDKTQIQSQLLGRLMSQKEPEIHALLNQAKQWKDGYWLCPLNPSLTPPGGPLIRTLPDHVGTVNAVAVMQDNKCVISASEDRTLKIWDIESWKVLHTLEGHKKPVKAVAVTQDGKRAISASEDRTLKIWDIESWKVLYTLEGHKNWVNAVAITQDGQYIISASSDTTIKVWKLESGEVIKTLNGHNERVNAVTVMQDGKHIITASDDKTLKVWDMESWKVLRTIEGHTSGARAVVVTQDGRHAISTSDDKTLKVWDVKSWKERHTLKDHKDRVNGVAVMQDGKRAVSASSDNSLRVWDIERGKVLYTLEGHTGGVRAVAVTRDGRYVISASADKTLKVWDLEKGGELYTIEGHNKWVKAIVVTQNGKCVISASGDGTLKVWDLERGDVLHKLEGHNKKVEDVVVTQDGRYAVSASSDKTLKVWDLESFTELHTLKGHIGGINAVVVTQDGKRVISASDDKTIKIWDMENYKELLTLEGHKKMVGDVVVTQDGKRVISCSEDKTLKIWDIENGKLLHTLEGHDDMVRAVVVTQDGKRAISASNDKTLKVWDLEKAELLHTLEGHDDMVRAVVVTQDGKRIISASNDKTLKVWDLENGELLHTLNHSGGVRAVVVMEDGKRVISASEDKTLKVWNIEKGEFIVGFNGDSHLLTCAVSPNGKTIIAGDQIGRMHFLRLEGAE